MIGLSYRDRNSWKMLIDAENKIRRINDETGQLKDMLDNWKREIRYSYKKSVKIECEPSWKYDDIGERRYVILHLNKMSEEEKVHYREKNWEHWYNPWEDGRDCTGVWFTTSMKIMDVGDKTYVVHWQACDI